MAQIFTWQDVCDVAPELAAVTDVGSQTALLNEAQAQLSPAIDNWGALYRQGVLYLTAHLATLALRRGSGPVTAESVGQLSRSYANLVNLHGYYGTTAYGVEFMRLVKLLPTALGACF